MQRSRDLDSIDQVITCPSKMEIMKILLSKKTILVEELENNENIIVYSLPRHLQELERDKEIKKDGDVITITNHGEKIAKEIKRAVEGFTPIQSVSIVV